MTKNAALLRTEGVNIEKTSIDPPLSKLPRYVWTGPKQIVRLALKKTLHPLLAVVLLPIFFFFFALLAMESEGIQIDTQVILHASNILKVKSHT